MATTICCIRAGLVPELLDEGYRDGPTARDRGTHGKGTHTTKGPTARAFSHVFGAPVNEGGALTYTKMLWGVCMYVCMYVFLCVYVYNQGQFDVHITHFLMHWCKVPQCSKGFHKFRQRKAN